MSLPANYKQIALGLPSTAPSQPSSSGGQRSRASGSSSASNKEPASPFVHSSHGNPAFTPQKATGKTSANADASRGPKAPKAPEKPLMPYMRYSRRVWDSVKVNYPEHKLWELGKVIGQMWRDLDESEKQVFIDEHDLEKNEYEKAMRTYHSSPAYLAFLAAKNRVKASDADTHETPSRPAKGSQQDRRIDIQPAEDEDDQDDGYSVKHVAYARFLRNHRLINEIFSDMAVPDVRTVVTTSRMQVLKRQVQSLTMHQMKLEAELLQMEDKFESKKRKLVESSEIFQDELKKHCKPAVDEDKFQKMVERQYDVMKAERMRQLEEPAASVPKPSLVQRTDDADMSSVAAQPTNTASSATTDAQPTEHEPMDTDAPPEVESTKPAVTSVNANDVSDKSPVESDSNSNSNPATLVATKPVVEAEKVSAEPPQQPAPVSAAVSPANDSPKEADPVAAPPPLLNAPVPSPPIVNPNTFAPAMPSATAATPPPPASVNPPAQHIPTAASNVAASLANPPPPAAAAAPPHSAPLTHPNHPVVAAPPVMPPHPESTPISGGVPPITTPPPPQSPSQQQSMQHHHAQQPPPPPQHNIPPHMAQHQAMSGHPGMPAHPPYGPFPGAGGPPRSPYYPPQYAGHPGQPPYHQYPAYPYHQQYGPPPSHYMGQRAPPQGGPPMHYAGEHVVGGPPQQHPLDGVGGGPYAPAPHQMPPGSPQQMVNANQSPPIGGPPSDHQSSGDEKK